MTAPLLSCPTKGSFWKGIAKCESGEARRALAAVFCSALGVRMRDSAIAVCPLPSGLSASSPREGPTPASSPPLLQAHTTFQNNPPHPNRVRGGAGLPPRGFSSEPFLPPEVTLTYPRAPLSTALRVAMETEHSSRLPSSLFTLVRDCGKNQPAAEGEGGWREERKPACSKPDHSGSEWSPLPLPRPFPIPGAARPGLVGCVGKLWAFR